MAALLEEKVPGQFQLVRRSSRQGGGRIENERECCVLTELQQGDSMGQETPLLYLQAAASAVQLRESKDAASKRPILRTKTMMSRVGCSVSECWVLRRCSFAERSGVWGVVWTAMRRGVEDLSGRKLSRR